MPEPSEAAPGPPRGGPGRRWTALALATAGGAGYAPWAPGTFGSAVGVLLAVGLSAGGAGALGIGVAALVASVLGVWASDEAERIFRHHDDGRIVIDEVAGQLLALWPLAGLLSPENLLAPLPLLAAFGAFRALDIVKPGPVRWAERRFPGGLGVMADDLVAGAGAGALVTVLALAGLFG